MQERTHSQMRIWVSGTDGGERGACVCSWEAGGPVCPWAPSVSSRCGPHKGGGTERERGRENSPPSGLSPVSVRTTARTDTGRQGPFGRLGGSAALCHVTHCLLWGPGFRPQTTVTRADVACARGVILMRALHRALPTVSLSFFFSSGTPLDAARHTSSCTHTPLSSSAVFRHRTTGQVGARIFSFPRSAPPVPFFCSSVGHMLRRFRKWGAGAGSRICRLVSSSSTA